MGDAYLEECENCNYKTELMTGFQKERKDTTAEDTTAEIWKN